MKVYNPEDFSLIELSTQNEDDLIKISCNSDNVQEYAKFTNTNYNIVVGLEEQITKHGHLNLCQTPSDNESHISNLINT